MGQKVQREYVKRGRNLTFEEANAAGGHGDPEGLYKIYVIEDLDTGNRQIRGSKVAEEELKRK